MHSCLVKSDALISDLMVSYYHGRRNVFYLANHPENSTNEIQVIQTKIINDLENLLAVAALFWRPRTIIILHHIRQRR